MIPHDDVQHIVGSYLTGVYTLQETYPRLAKATTRLGVSSVLDAIPLDIRQGFIRWAREYPFDDGAFIAGEGEDDYPIEAVRNILAYLDK